MLAIRMQRTGRKGHAHFRVVVQDSRWAPTSGKFVALIGSYDPHNKTSTLAKDKAEFYLKHGAQPSDRVVRLLKQEGVKLPSWVNEPTDKARNTRNPEKLRANRPDEPEQAQEAPAEAEEATPVSESEEQAEPAQTETPAEPVAESETTEPAAEEASAVTPEESAS